jgi:large subunit ribosomal protein L15
MRLNTLSPQIGARKDAKRVGRGIGCGFGKTCGRGHKGQKSRAGGFHKVGFEGGQMPLQRRLPKVGFSSRKGRFVAEIRLSELNRFDDGATVDMQSLRDQDLIAENIQEAKVIVSGKLTKKVELRGLRATAGAKKIVEELGGSVV